MNKLDIIQNKKKKNSKVQNLNKLNRISLDLKEFKQNFSAKMLYIQEMSSKLEDDGRKASIAQ